MEQADSNKTQRLGNVFYYLGLSFSLLIALGIASAMYSYEDWLPYVNSLRLFAFFATGLGIVVFLEIVRRTSSYVVSGKDFLDRKIPLFLIILVVIYAVSGIASATMKYGIEPGMEKSWRVEQKSKDEALLQELTIQFSEQRDKAQSCLVVTQEEKYQEAKELCDARYRRVKMGYDSCMTYGWRTMCLGTDDYEVIDCSEEVLKKPIETYYPVCALDVLTTKNRIDSLQEKIDSY
jgi:hypothetical protein